MRYLILYLMVFYSCFGGIVINRRVMTQNFPYVMEWDNAGKTNTYNLTTTGNVTANICKSFDGFYVYDSADTSNSGYLFLGTVTNFSIVSSQSGTGTTVPLSLYTKGNTSQIVLNTDGSTTMGGSANYTQISSAGDLSFAGTAGIVLPHLMQSDSTDQAISNATAEQIITFNTDVHHNLITRTSASRFTITKAGSYLLTFSAIGICADAVPGKYFVIWMKLNGNNVANSATYYTFKSQNFNAVVTVTFLYHFAANDYFEFWMYGNDTDIKLDATAAVEANPGVIPAIPACPSIIMTCQYVGKD